MKEFWDQRYSEHESVYGQEPNLFFKSFIDTEKPATILLPSEGEGRNAVYAAKKGWNVHAVDFSRVAGQKALDFASRESVNIDYEVCDLADWKSDIRVDSIGLIYAHFGPDLRTKLHKQFMEMLNPGGKIVMEVFSKDQIHYNSGGPKDISTLYSIDMLKMDFNGINFILLEKLVTEVNESEFHKGRASIIRMIAQKK